MQGKQILNRFVPRSFLPSNIERKIDNSEEIEKIAQKVISENKEAVENYKKGKTKALDFLMGKIMKTTNRRADFKVTRDILQKILND